MLHLKLCVLICLAWLPAGAQCLSGNCDNGTGRYDFGWCAYEGAFRDGKPSGNGKMTYSDYTYIGRFSDGVEDGDGIIVYKDGRREAVRYAAGQKIEGPAKLAAGAYQPVEARDPGCIDGDCRNGAGAYQFESGNKYVGHFRDRKREGQGTAYYANGDKYEGGWHDNERTSGTYTYSNGARYTGTYDSRGVELDGKFISAGGYTVIPVIGGKAHIPPPPKAEPVAAGRSASRPRPEDPAIKPCCPDCHCTGQTHETFYGGGVSIDKYGNRSRVFGASSRCMRCGGTGHVN